LIGKIQDLEKKKKYYKQMARSMKTEIVDLKKYPKTLNDMQKLLGEKDEFIVTLKKRMEYLEKDAL